MPDRTPLAFLVLAHDDWDHLRRLLIKLSEDNRDTVVVHIDRRVPRATFDTFKNAIRRQNLLFLRAQRCYWGDYSLVEATLRCLDMLAACGRPYDYVTLISGHDYPVRPIAHLRKFLSRANGQEFIECFEMSKVNWTKNGPYCERYSYNFTPFAAARRSYRLLTATMALNKLLKIDRQMPCDLNAFSGSQWWTLTRQATEMLRERAKHKAIIRFFRTTLIPDEMYFQTLLANSHFVDCIAGRNLSFISWNHDGRPEWLTKTHVGQIERGRYFFARKIASRDNDGLVDVLDEQMAQKVLDF